MRSPSWRASSAPPTWPEALCPRLLSARLDLGPLDWVGHIVSIEPLGGLVAHVVPDDPDRAVGLAG